MIVEHVDGLEKVKTVVEHSHELEPDKMAVE